MSPDFVVCYQTLTFVSIFVNEIVQIFEKIFD